MGTVSTAWRLPLIARDRIDRNDDVRPKRATLGEPSCPYAMTGIRSITGASGQSRGTVSI